MRKLVRRDAAEEREGGFTLVEMVIAISVLAVIMMAVAGVLNSGLRALAAAKGRARANEIATQGIEDLQRFSFNNLGFCSPPATPAPAGLETPVMLGCTGTFAEEDPCHPSTPGTVPRPVYTCAQNNITYTVKRHVAWVDELRTTKRLAVYVEWDDLVGRHQVSQQSSLRAPDQSAITGLAPPTFNATQVQTSSTPLLLDATGRLQAGQTVNLHATTTNLTPPAATSLATPLPTHQSNDHIDIEVASITGFPGYNGFPVNINGESYTVIAGAGTDEWTLRADNTGPAVPSGPVEFPGDRVYATIQTLAANGSPQTSTVFLSADAGSTTSWRTSITSNSPNAADPFAFGPGTQYVAFGIMRAADGKTTSAFADGTLAFCGSSDSGGCAAAPAPPTFSSVTVPSGNVPVGTSGELTNDLVVGASTLNLTGSDVVTVSLLTQSGSVSVALSVKAGTTCPDSATATAGVPCQWEGRIARSAGYRFSPGSQKVYFSGQQVLDTINPDSIDDGSTAVPSQPAPSVTFGAA